MRLVLGFVICTLLTKTAWASPQLSRLHTEDGNQRGLSSASEGSESHLNSLQPRFLGVAAVAGAAGAAFMGIGFNIRQEAKKWAETVKMIPKDIPIPVQEPAPQAPITQPRPEPSIQEPTVKVTQSQIQEPSVQPSQVPKQSNIPSIQISAPPTTPPATKPTPTSTSTEEPCTICIKCDDDETEEQETDPLSGSTLNPEFDLDVDFHDAFGIPDDYTDLISLLLPNEKGDEKKLELQKRANDRDFSVCEVPTSAPSYTGWSSTKMDSSLPIFGYYLEKACPNYDWELRPNERAPRRGSKSTYATEHIYEINLIKRFVHWQMRQEKTLAYVTKYRKSMHPCNAIFKPLFAPAIPWWKTGTFTPNKAPIADLADTLSGDNKPGELVYLNSDLNILKNKVMSINDFRTGFQFRVNLLRAAKLNLVQQYLADDEVVDIWRKVSNRVHGFYKKLDSAIAASDHPFIMRLREDFETLKWADDYRTWERRYLRVMGTNVVNAVDEYIRVAETQIGDKNSEEKRYKVNIQKAKAKSIEPFRAFWQSLLQ